MTGVRGPIQIAAVAAQAALKSVTRGGRDISGQVLELLGTERVDDVVITLTYETGGIQGVVEAEPEESLSAATVVVYPDEPGKWNVGTPFVRSARLAGSGPGRSAASSAAPGSPTTAQALPPGPASSRCPVWLRAATSWSRSPRKWRGSVDPQTLERWRESGKMVTVDAGQTATVKVTRVR